MANSGPARSQYWPSPSYTCFLGCWILVWASNKTEKKKYREGWKFSKFRTRGKICMSCLQCCRSIIGIVQESHFWWPVLDEDTKNEDFHLKKIQIQVQIHCLESESSTTCEYQLAMECNLCRLPFNVLSKHSEYENLEKFSLNSCYP